MGKILIVCSGEKGKSVYKENLKNLGYLMVDSETTAASAKRKLLEEDYNLIIIDSPLKDENGVDLAISLAEKSLAAIILVVKADKLELVNEVAEKNGVFLVTKPFVRIIFGQAIKFAFTSINKFTFINNENKNLQKKVEDIKRIDRAKCLLIQYKNISEEEAHRIIEKRAMNERISRRKVAEEIIKFYQKTLLK